MEDNHIPPHNDIILSEPKQPDNNERNRLIIVCIAALIAIVCLTAFIITRDNRVLEWTPALYFFYCAVNYSLGRLDKR